MRPWLGFIPTSPLNAAGMRVEPPPSLAVPKGMRPAATAAAEPPLEPPGVRSVFQGLRVVPHALVCVNATVPNSGAAVLPTGTAPAARSRATWGESSATGGRSLYSSEPCEVGMPPQSSRSFTPKGTPASTPGSSPRATLSSTASAAWRAMSGFRWTNAFSRSLPAAIASRHSSSTSTALSSPRRTASAISMTVFTDWTLRRSGAAFPSRR